MRFGDFSVKNPVFVNLLMIFIILVGLFSYFFAMNREVFPNISFDMVLIQTIYPGVAPDEIEKLITIPIEDEVSKLDGIDHIESISLEGISTIVVFMKAEEDDIRTFRQDVETEVDKVADLPADAEDPEISEIEADFPAINVAFRGPASETTLKKWLEEFEDELDQIDGIGDITRIGVRDREFQVSLNSTKMHALGVSPDDVVRAIRNTNLNIPGGDIETTRGEILIRTLGEVKSPREIADVVVRSSGTLQTVRIGDIATVEDAFEDETVRTRVNGEPAMALMIQKSEEGDVIQLVDAVKEKVKQYQKMVPEDVIIEDYQDTSTFVRERLSVMQSNGIVGLLIVLFLLYLFLSARMSILVAMGLPIAFLIAIILMNWTGATINMLSLFGLIMVLGILVDDGIIVAENVYRHREMGMPMRQAAIMGTNEVVLPIFAAVMTTIAAFLPLMLMTGILGKFVRIIPVAVITALIGSLLECYFVLPSHLADFGEPSPPREGFFHHWGNMLLRKKERPSKKTGCAGLSRMVEKVFLGISRMTLVYLFKPLRAFVPSLTKTYLVAVGLHLFFIVAYWPFVWPVSEGMTLKLIKTVFMIPTTCAAYFMVSPSEFWGDKLNATIFIGLAVYAVIFAVLSLIEAFIMLFHFITSEDPNPPSRTLRRQIWGRKPAVPLLWRIVPMPMMGVYIFWILVAFFPMLIYIQEKSEIVTQVFFIGLLLLSPLLLVWDKYLRPGFNRLFDRFRRWYVGILRYFLHYRYLWVATIVLLLLFSFGWAAAKMKVELFPTQDIEQFYINVEAPVGTNLDRMEKYVSPIEAMIKDYPDNVIESISTTVGMKQDESFGGVTYGKHYAQILVDLESPKINPMVGMDVVNQLRDRLQREYSGASWELNAQGGGPPVGKPVNVRVRGEDFEVLAEISNQIKTYLQTIPGVVEIKDNFLEGKEEYRVHLDLERMNAMGLDVGTVGSRIRAAFDGIEASDVQTVDEEVTIRVQYRETDRAEIADLENMQFVIPAGGLVPFRNFARIESYRGIDTIRHYDQKRTVTVTAELLDNAEITSLEVSEKVNKQFAELMASHPGYTMQFGGESEDTEESLQSLAKAFLMAALLIYVILSTQFKSFIQSLLIITAVPFGLIGVIWGFYAIGEPFGFISMMGIVALSGVIVNDSIVLMDFVNGERAKGTGRWKSILRAAQIRLRPVILTTVTTIGGLMTISFGQRGATAFLSPMGLALIFGMSFGTVVTLITVPCLRAILDDLLILVSPPEYHSRRTKKVPEA